MSDGSGITSRYKVRTFRFYGYAVATFHITAVFVDEGSAYDKFLSGTRNDTERHIFRAILSPLAPTTKSIGT